MSGNIENRSGCFGMCSRWLDRVCNISSCIRTFPYRRCFVSLLAFTVYHYVRTVLIVLSTVLLIVSWTEFKGKFTIVVSVYVGCLMLCIFLTFFARQGHCKISSAYEIEKRQLRYFQGGQGARQQTTGRQGGRGARQQTTGRQGGQGARQQTAGRQGGQGARQQIAGRHGGQRARYPIRHLPEGTEQLPIEALSNPVEQRQAVAPEQMNVRDVQIDIHRVEEPSESSNSIEPASVSSDEPLQQVALSDLGGNIPQSSADPSTSTKSTHSTPLDDTTSGDPRNDESLQQALPSDSGNIAESSTDPSPQ